ncbi:MAG: glycosyltransferase family 4 protein [Maioricimonas sp. JB049]
MQIDRRNMVNNSNLRKLLICSRAHVPHGGADRIIADLCRELPDRGWQVTLGLTRGERFNDVDQYRDVLGSDLPIVEIDGRLGTRRARLKSLGRLIRQERPDVVLSMRVFDAYEAVAREKHRSGCGPHLAVGVRSFEAGYLCDLILYRELIDLCVTSGELIATAAVDECGLDRSRVVSIGGGIHPPVVEVTPRTPRRPFVLLYAGRLEFEQKRVGDLVLLTRELRRRGLPFRLHIAGVGPAEHSLRQQLADEQADGRVVFHGWLSRERLYRELYPQADCFVHFAAWEGITIAPREAMVHGVVPVISRFRGLEVEGQFVDGETALTFPVGDVEAAADQISRLLEVQGLLQRLSRNAMRSQQGKYLFEGSMDAWARALEQTARRPPLAGVIPRVDQQLDGRLIRWGVTVGLQEGFRQQTGRKVRHRSPGSEWPTCSGRVTEVARLRFDRFADSLEGER